MPSLILALFRVIINLDIVHVPIDKDSHVASVVVIVWEFWILWLVPGKTKERRILGHENGSGWLPDGT